MQLHTLLIIINFQCDSFQDSILLSIFALYNVEQLK